MPYVIRAPRFGDYEQWKLLFDGYNAFYGREGPTALAPATVATETLAPLRISRSANSRSSAWTA